MNKNSILRAHNSNKGFTLIEILIVVAIIGLLTSIILVGLGSFRSRGRDARRIADLRETQNGLELYYTKNGYYPPNINSWSDLSTALIGAGIGISSVANDPLSPQAHYSYAVPSGSGGAPQNYVLAATLEDSGNAAFKDSPQGNIYGIACGAPVYCVQF